MTIRRSRVSAAEARGQFAELVNRAAYAKERQVLTRRGKAVAAIVPLEDLELLEQLEDRIDLDEALESLREAEEQGTLSWKALKDELGL
jgi:prevent-host-death family protein